MNMFKPTKAKTVAQYLKEVPAEHKELMEALHTFIQKSVPMLKTHFATNMIGYGTFLYRNSKNDLLEWPVIALANQKNYVSLYICSINNGRYLAESYAKELGKVKVGKSCIQLKKLEDIHLPVLKDLLVQAAKNPGLAP